MPLKSRVNKTTEAADPAAKPTVESRDKHDVPLYKGDTLDQQESSAGAEGAENEDNQKDTPDDPAGDEAGTPESGQKAPAKRRPGRPAGSGKAAAPVTEGEAVSVKERLSEIAREAKQLKSEYTAEVKSIEAAYGEKLKALRAEHDLLSAQVASAAFSL